MLSAAFFLIAILAGWIVWETVALSVEDVEIAIEGLPPEFDGFRIAQVSDLHGKRFDPVGTGSAGNSRGRGGPDCRYR
jgi:predicted MPP superfamily phosphohydrolase